MSESQGQTESASRPTLGQLAALFLRLGATSFGGPAVHIAMMEDEVVTRRRWLTRAEYLDLLAATNLIPGPNSTEMAIHVGLRAGWLGLIVAGVCFIAPAMLIVGVAAWAYVEFGALPEVAGILYGIKPVLIAVVLQALWRLGRDSVKSLPLALLCALAVVAQVLGVHELLTLFVAGVSAAAMHGIAKWREGTLASIVLAVLPAGGIGLGAASPTVGLWPMFLFFLKVGSVLFGSGYVLLAFLHADLVERFGWLTERQLLDAIAIGQVTPGPVFTTATFIGYVLGGWTGAGAATAGIFLPAFFFVAISGPLVPRLRSSPTAGAFLDGIVVASLSLMAVVTWELGRATLVDLPTTFLALVSAVLLLRFRVNSSWLALGGAALGIVVTLLGWK